MAVAWGGALGMIAALACSHDTTSSDDGGGFTVHCGDDLGHATCQAAFPTKPFCDLCKPKSESLGCTSSPPAPACSPEGTSISDTGEASSEGEDSSSETTAVDPTTSTATSPDTTAGDSESTGISIACEEEGQLDEDCEAANPSTPYCIGATCVGCLDVGADEFCGALDETLPVCDASTSVCLGCEMGGEGFCTGDAPVCDATGACRGCESHLECSGTACHLAEDDPLAGACFTEEEVLWVDRGAICPGQGSEAVPYCSLAATLAALGPGDNAVIALVGATPYDEHVIAPSGATIAILGTAGVPQLVGELDLDEPSLAIEGARVYMQGVRVVGNTETHGITCADGTLWLEQSEVRQNDDYGIYLVGPCDVTMRRASVHNNPGGGIRQLGGRLVLDNAVVGRNGDGGQGPGINLMYADLSVLYSTIAGNDGVGDDSIQCLDSTGTVRNSVITGADVGSVDLDCFVLDFSTNAIDTTQFAGAESELVDEPYDVGWFIDPDAGDFRLLNPPFTPFRDVALWTEGDPLLDADGTARPQGGELGYAGVDEP